MDSNKDEAERCVKISINALCNNQPDKARRFVEKAKRLFPTDQAKSLLESIEHNGKPPHEDETPMNGDGSAVRHRSHGDEARSSPGDSATDSSKPYTSDQLDAVKTIKSCKDYYEIPGVEKDVGEEDLKKSHRKLALKFHPDLKIRLQEPQRHFKPLAMHTLC